MPLGRHWLPKASLFPRPRLVARASILAIAYLLTLKFLSITLNTHGLQIRTRSKLAPGDEDVPWSRITPSETLVYSPCFDGLRCARLRLPLDWQNTTGSNKSVAIALLKVPAKVPVTDPRYGGSIFINPGGPGGSGAMKAYWNGRQIQTIADPHISPKFTAIEQLGSKLGSKDGMYFDIIGFDPRGIGHSTPKLECFPSYLARQYWVIQSKAEGILGSSDIAFDMKWARWQSLATACMERIAEEGEDSIAYHMNTTPLVADMIALLERHGEWRETQAKAWLSTLTGRFQTLFRHSSHISSRQAILERCRWRRGQEKIMYWGVSYGTIIGQMFASMHPERISRFVLDGVVLTFDYFSGNWASNIQRADAAFDKFFDYCYQSGLKHCPFYAEEDPQSIKLRYYELLFSLKRNPITVPASNTRSPDVITSSDVMSRVKDALYCPLQSYPPLAQLLADLSTNNGSSMANLKQAGVQPFHPPDKCKHNGPFSIACQIPYGWEDEASVGIHCSDAESSNSTTKESFKQYADLLTNQSRVMGPTWAEIRMSCISWKTRPKWRYNGPFRAKTAHPILFIGNALDPVTPLSNAIEAALNFPDSAILQQDSPGHTALSMPSLCTAEAVRKYFQTGELPELGMVCKPDEYPFLEGTSCRSLGGDEALCNALREAAMHC